MPDQMSFMSDRMPNKMSECKKHCKIECKKTYVIHIMSGFMWKLISDKLSEHMPDRKPEICKRTCQLEGQNNILTRISEYMSKIQKTTCQIECQVAKMVGGNHPKE